MNLKWDLFGKIFLLFTFIFFYCEYFIYYLVINQCSWPDFQVEHENSMTKAMFLADIHLLGPFRGHWFDKLRREWQMYRSFQTAVSLFHPEVIFILGDLFDEGQWCDKKLFEDYIDRFFSLFKVSKGIKLYVVPGNHDIGFHYALRPYLLNKFQNVFNTSNVQLLNFKENYFVLINSMAMEGDNCYLCLDAESKLKEISEELNCLKNGNCIRHKNSKKYSRPIIVQHFPMYRKSDVNCKEIDEAPPDIKNNLFKEKWDCLSKEASEMELNCLKNGNCIRHKNSKKYRRPIIVQHFPMYRKSDMNCKEIDEAPPDIKNSLFKEKWDCLSKEASEMIYSELNPRAIFTGHLHHGCVTLHQQDIYEYTIPSFSWRNKNNPTFTLAIFTPQKYVTKICSLPRESTVIFLYCSTVLGSLMWIIYKLRKHSKYKTM